MEQVARTRSGPNWRILGWSLAAGLLSLPFFAMQLGAPGVDWSVGDFVVMGAMLAGLGFGFEFLARRSGSWCYRLGSAIMALGCFGLVWVNLAVGIIGSEREPVNLYFFLIIIVGVVSAVAGGFRPGGMVRTMLAMATAQLAVPAIALLLYRDVTLPSLPELTGLTAFYTLSWLFAAWLFSRAR